MTGGIAGTINYPPGNGNILQFTNAGIYDEFHPGSPVRTATYRIAGPGAGSFPVDQILFISFTDNGSPYTMRDSVRIAGNHLVFLPMSGCCDMPTMSYIRKND